MKSVLAPRVQEVPIKPLVPRLAVDFDGVIHSYSKGWCRGACYDVPMPGCAEALRELSKRYEMVVFTARHDLRAVEDYLVQHRLSQHFRDVTNRKPRANFYLDDRGLRFVSWDQALEDLRAPAPSQR